jgi:hypothetical protein
MRFEVPDAGWVFHASASGLFASDVQYAPEPAGLAVAGALVAGLLLADPSGDRRRSRGRDR